MCQNMQLPNIQVSIQSLPQSLLISIKPAQRCPETASYTKLTVWMPVYSLNHKSHFISYSWEKQEACWLIFYQETFVACAVFFTQPQGLNDIHRFIFQREKQSEIETLISLLSAVHSSNLLFHTVTV